MKSGFFIMKLWQTGNIGSNNIKALKDNPKDGYDNYNEAKIEMFKLHSNKNWDLTLGSEQCGFKFTIMELFW